MTLLEKIKREVGDSEVTPTTLNGRKAIEIRQGSFVATIYADAATVQIRHLDVYQLARRAAEALRAGGIRNHQTLARFHLDLARFRERAGRSVEGDPACA